MKWRVDKGGFLRDVEMICYNHNGSVTSWIRSEQHNAEVGGIPDSLHITGYACDIVFDTAQDREDSIRVAKQLGYDVVPYDTGHIHIEVHL